MDSLSIGIVARFQELESFLSIHGGCGQQGSPIEGLRNLYNLLVSSQLELHSLIRKNRGNGKHLPCSMNTDH